MTDNLKPGMSSTLGYLVVITGPMFAGKTTTLIKELLTLKQTSPETRILVLNHVDDERNDGQLSPHLKLEQLSDNDFHYRRVSQLSTVNVDDYDVIAVDEAQFFDDLIESVKWWLRLDKTVFCAGLTLDYRNEPFGDLLQLIPHADKLFNLRAKCVRCLAQAKRAKLNTAAVQHSFTNAIYSKRLVDVDGQKLIGDHVYQPVCRFHYYHDRLSDTRVSTDVRQRKIPAHV